MFDIDDIMFYFYFLFCIVLTLLLIFVVSVFMYDIFTGKSCYAKYENAKHSFWGGCLVEYKGNYIPNELYEKAFTKDININLK